MAFKKCHWNFRPPPFILPQPPIFVCVWKSFKSNQASVWKSLSLETMLLFSSRFRGRARRRCRQPKQQRHVFGKPAIPAAKGRDLSTNEHLHRTSGSDFSTNQHCGQESDQGSGILIRLDRFTSKFHSVIAVVHFRNTKTPVRKKKKKKGNKITTHLLQFCYAFITLSLIQNVLLSFQQIFNT